MALASCALESLDLCLADDATVATMDPRWVSDDWASVGSLRLLKLRVDNLTQVDWAFVERFAETLETLEVWFSRFGSSETLSEAPVLFKPFPRLRHVALEGEAENAATLLASLTTSPIATLTLRLHHHDSSEVGRRIFHAPSPLSITLTSLSPTLAYLQAGLTTWPTLDEVETDALNEFCRSEHIHLSHSGQFSAHVSTMNYSDQGDARRMVESEVLWESLQEVLLKSRSRRHLLQRAGDVEGLNLLVHHTKGIKALLDIWRD